MQQFPFNVLSLIFLFRHMVELLGVLLLFFCLNCFTSSKIFSVHSNSICVSDNCQYIEKLAQRFQSKLCKQCPIALLFEYLLPVKYTVCGIFCVYKHATLFRWRLQRIFTTMFSFHSAQFDMCTARLCFVFTTFITSLLGCK